MPISRIAALAIGITLLAATVAAPAGAVDLASPDPGGDPEAPLSAPPEGKYLGFNDDSAHSLHGLVPADYAELTRTAGGNVIRASLDWRDAEPIEDHWEPGSWARWQDLYDRALERGLTPLFTIGFAPSWARDAGGQACGEGCRLPPAAGMDGEWAEFAAEVARRFPDALIEVWNEPNLRYFWGSGADPQRYAELLDVAHDAIEEVSPNTLVLAGGLSNVQVTGGGHIALREYADSLYRATPSIAGNMDALSFHPYIGALGLGSGTLFAKSFHDVRTARDANGDATPLFVTEVGASLGAPDLWSEHGQAETMMALYRRTMTMDDVMGVVFHRLIAPADTTADPWELGAGWTSFGANPPAPREVYCRFVADGDRWYPGCPASAPRPTTFEIVPRAVTKDATPTFIFESPKLRGLL